MQCWVVLTVLVLRACGGLGRRDYPNFHHHGYKTAAAAGTPPLGEVDKYTTVDTKTGTQHNSYNKHHPGRHVCTSQKSTDHPTKTKQAYCKPSFKNYSVRCYGDQICKGVRLVYETHYKDVISTRNSNEVTYSCCPGWTQVTNRSYGCNKPSCSKPCLNGGKCVKPELCACLKGFNGPQCELTTIDAVCSKPCINGGKCVYGDICSCVKGFGGQQCEINLNKPHCSMSCENGGTCVRHEVCRCIKGFTGRYCEQDVDECKEEKPCDQICYNTPGSYNCQCREDFLLQSDGQSCRKEDTDGGIEVKDLEFELLDKRLQKLETMMDESQKNDVSKNDIQNLFKDINFLSTDVKNLKNKVTDVVFPLLYGLMERKTFSAYLAVFQYVNNDLLPNFLPASIMADYEEALRRASTSIWENLELRGCWFHFAQAVYKKSRRLGLQDPENINTRRLVKMAMALPLLPQNQVEAGVEILSNEAVPGTQTFIGYLRRYWLPRNISVYRQPQRTNNAVESLHRDLFRMVGRPHPNMWMFVEKLKIMEHSKSCDLTRLENGIDLPRRRRVLYRRTEERIRRAQDNFDLNPNIRIFLIQMSHIVERLPRIFGPAEDLNIYADGDENAEEELPHRVDVMEDPDNIARIINGALQDDTIVQNNEREPSQDIDNDDREVARLARCVVCLIQPRTQLLRDCNHMIMCDECITHFHRRVNEWDDDENYKNDMFVFKSKLSSIEKKADKIDDLIMKYERIKRCAFYNKICL